MELEVRQLGHVLQLIALVMRFSILSIREI
jgi:hypothetical protein